MTVLRNRRIDRAGGVVFDADGLVDLLYEGFGDFGGLTVEPSPEIATYNAALQRFRPGEQPLEVYRGEPDDIAASDAAHAAAWRMPERYRTLDVRAMVLARCERPDEIERVEQEMVLFEERGMIDVLRFLCYFVDTLRENKVLWGIGRGSSVASYVLYKIGVHRIDSLRFDLSIAEFLK
jgi:DNA polymerase III alpha subunit